MINLQKMQNEFEHSQADAKRRLESQIEFYETELQSIRAKLNEERDSSKVFSIRHENEIRELRNRIEKLVRRISRK